jgi:hypothetical protein
MPKSFLELVPHSDYVDFSGARHMVAGDRNDHFSAAVLYFIDLKFRPLGEYLCRAHNAPMDLHFALRLVIIGIAVTYFLAAIFWYWRMI